MITDLPQGQTQFYLNNEEPEMTTDRELLDLAAKAAGIDVDPSILFARGVISWNPLVDDGDALRLAVKLELQLDCARYLAWGTGETFGHEGTANGVDGYAATRRAIVRAAAEIGRDMK